MIAAIGGLRRPDGAAKLTGAADYAADTPVDGVTHAALVPATVATGRIAHIDTAAAVRAPGVLAVLTHTDMPRLKTIGSPPLGQSVLPLQDDTVRYEGQPVAMVLAETFEQARRGAELVRATYADVAVPRAFGDGESVTPRPGLISGNPAGRVGDVEAGLAAATTVVTATYTTPNRHHSPMEPSATVASWHGDQLTVHESTQWVFGTQMALAAAFDLPADHVRVVCPFIGGGFGCKGFVWPHTLLAAAAARVTGRPVKLVLTRAQMFTSCGHQPATTQTLTLGTDDDGRLTAVRHHSVNPTSTFDDYAENATGGTRWMYASPAIDVAVLVEHTSRQTPTPMRAPAEGLGMFALESAMDELAYALRMDPVELRLRNEPAVDPMTGQPFSSRPLPDCLRAAAQRFGWSGRPAEPRSMRDGDELVGWGMASVTMDTFRLPSSARVRLQADGRTIVEAGTQEIGTGLPGVLTTIAAQTLGVDPGSVEVHHGDTDLPETSGTFGSSATMGVGSAVAAAATELRDKLDALAGTGAYPRRLADAGLDSLDAEARWDPAERGEGRSIHTYGAIFVEVRVDPDLGLVRMPRCTATYAAGRIINPLTARSQMIGGIAWGYGQAMLEESILEPQLGRFLSKNMAGYLVPVCADIGDIDVSFIEDPDTDASPLGAKGIGELGAVGVSAAIANAVFHATGIRVRDLPISIERLLNPVWDAPTPTTRP
ncbi:xanthine dehydrogenase family protein molybdopterin-binding subunit [Specibacter cremeus]|uniref:xanthine dehydrogenase family protein molybdopterin-binding subunit n=1 Tax=Specibacter cremeus TaxID=1629051 RepID=UPI00197C375D|nr:xanthine dehydrogenase family protein molybdopterin-binding subunit [Specibacter cremeus]